MKNLALIEFRKTLVANRLSSGLGLLALESKHFDQIGIRANEDPSKPRCECKQFGDVAIENLRNFQQEIQRCTLLADFVGADEAVSEALALCINFVHQMDVPAKIALDDGFDDEAVAICSDALHEVYEHCYTNLMRLSVQVGKHKPQREFRVGSGVNEISEEMINETTKGLHIENLEMEELLRNWKKEEPIRPDPDHVFRPVEWEILLICFQSPTTLKNDEIHRERDISRNRTTDSKSTREAVKDLVANGWLHRPHGEREGVTCTDSAKEILKIRLSTA